MLSVAPTTSTAARCYIRIVQNWQNLLRSDPTFNIDLLARDPVRRLHQCLMLASPSTELALSMRRNFNSDRCRPQVCHVAKKLYWTFAIPVFQFAVGGTHSAQRLNTALDALRHPRPFPTSELKERFLPN